MIFNRNYFYVFWFFRIYILCQNISNISYINNNETSIQNAIYIIRNRKGDLNLEFHYNLIFMNNEKQSLIHNFNIIKKSKNNTNDYNNTEDYYFIIYNSNKYITYNHNTNHLKLDSNILDIDFSLWKIIPKINEENKLVYYVQNKKTKKFWEISDNDAFNLKEKNISNLNKNNEFLFVELFKKVVKTDSKLLDEEPIDVFIKYIDLNDQKLNRTGITQIKKDFDNQELKYSVRSILKNIPWIRKIFILMPNEKIRFFKAPEEISEKIVYIKDKDILGFDSQSSSVFQFNLFKMKKFGLSENFILMDDDYFIAQPCSKNEFFYEENGTILPALIISDYYEMRKDKLLTKLSTNLVKEGNDDPHSPVGFEIQQTRTLLFMYNIMGNDEIRYGKKLIEPSFSHNAIPVKLSDVEEIYAYVSNKYEYANKTLNSLVRTTYDLQFQTLYMAYTKNKYDRKVSQISSSFYDLIQSRLVMLNKKKLFVINTSSRSYNQIFYKWEIEILNKLFPEKTKYESEEEDEIKKRKENNLFINTFGVKEIYNQIKLFDDKISVVGKELQNKLNKLKYISKKNEENEKKENFRIQLVKEKKELKEMYLRQKYFNIFLIVFILLLLINGINKYKNKKFH